MTIPKAFQCVFGFILIFSILLQLKPFSVKAAVFPPELKYLELIHEANEFNPDKEYDYIVVGGGTAGCPLAATLSENYSVLVLERGGDEHSNPNVIREENILVNVLQATADSSPAQGFISEDGVPLARGRVLGGSSMINYGFYSRGDDYFYNNSGIDLDMDSVNEAYDWVEESIVHRPDILNTWQTSTRDALLEAGVGPDNGNTFDHLTGTKVGGTTFDSTGARHGSVELLNKGNPKNLHVIVHAIVDKIIFSPLTETSGPSAVGVVYHDSEGKSYKVGIRKDGEVILSAGAIGSPQLLLMSGVGPKQDLKSLKVPVVLDQPSVGKYMADNPRTSLSLMVPFRLNDIGLRVVGITGNKTYIESVSGVTPFTSPVSPLFFPDPSIPVSLSMVYIVAKVARPNSRGSLWLNSPTDVTISPSVRFNYYSKPEDLRLCADVVVTIEKMLKTRAMEVYKFEDRDGEKYFQVVGRPVPANTSDSASMETHCRETLTTFYHYFGGCTVNKVVDGSLKVVGIGGLRVVDGSVFTVTPGTNPQATLLMLGRYMGLKIHNERVAREREPHDTCMARPTDSN